MRKPLKFAGPLMAVSAWLAGCASTGSSVGIVSQATGSAYFSLSPPGIYHVKGGEEVVGRVCRRSRNTLLSPSGVRVEHLGGGGVVLEVARASIPVIYRRADQPCSNYSARVGWTITEGDTVRACFERGKPCPAAAGDKAVIALPRGTSPIAP